jgi:AcrR family transcriptional regulator
MSVLDMPAVPETGSTAERVVDAALRCVARWGLTKTTIDDISREAGVGRATLYRLFPGGRDAVFEATVAAELARCLHRLESGLTGEETLEDFVVAAMVEAGTTLTNHAALQFLLAYEPEAILPHLAFQEMDALLRAVAALAGPYLQAWLPDAEASARAAEWIARITLSYVTTPARDVDLCDADSVRHLVRTYVIPGLQPTTTEGGTP